MILFAKFRALKLIEDVLVPAAVPPSQRFECIEPMPENLCYPDLEFLYAIIECLT
jgi:hypothetical protein